MAKRKKLIITREGYLFLAAVGILLLALIVIAIATKGFGACNKEAEEEVRKTPLASKYYEYVGASGKPEATDDEYEMQEKNTPESGTPAPQSTNAATPTAETKEDPTALTEPTEEMIAGAAKGKLSKGGVNMRQGPSVNTPVVASGLKKGTELTVYGIYGSDKNQFYFVLVERVKKYGYIRHDFVTLTSPLGETSDGSDQPEGTIRGKINMANLVLRDKPSPTGKTIKEYKQGKLVYIFHQEGEYYYILVAGTEYKGYMPAKFIKTEGAVPTKEP